MSHWNLLATKSTIVVNVAAAADNNDVVDVGIFIVITAYIFQ